MPTEKQRRAAAQRKLARQLARREEHRRRQKQRYAIAGSSFLVVAVVFLVLIFATDVFSGASKDSEKNNNAAATTSASASGSASAGPTPSPFATTTFATSKRTPKSTSGPCHYAETADTLKSPYNKDVGLPPDPNPTPATGTVQVSMTTSQGDMTLSLDRSAAPCAVQSFLYLAGKGFFNDTHCPRLTTSNIFVLQCGDPSSSQQGGPTYEFKEEVNGKTKYTAGAVAMANSNSPPSTSKPTTSSQFFMIYKDSTGLPKAYSVIGKITKGLDVVQKVADGKTDNSNQAGDGKPILGMTIKSAGAAA